jgi:hypothetical protein
MQQNTWLCNRETRQSSTVRYSTVDDARDTEVVRVRLRTSGLSKLNLVCSKTRGYAIARRDFRSWTRATRNLHDLLYKDRCSGNSKVNLVCGKVRGNRKLCSRETRLSILGTRDTKKIGLMFGHFESECSIQQNACRTEIYAIARREKKIVSAIDVRIQARIKWKRQLMQPDTSIGCPNRWKIGIDGGIDGRLVAMEDW